MKNVMRTKPNVEYVVNSHINNHYDSFYDLYSPQKWQCVLSMLTFVNKSVEKKTVKFTVSPTHSMLLFKDVDSSERETRTDTIFRHHSAICFIG